MPQVLAYCCALILAQAVSFAPAFAQIPDYLDGASPRLQLFAAPQGAIEIGQMQRALGLSGGQGVIFARAGLAPVLRYDPNINGGTPGETIKIGGLIFTLSEDSRAKAGLIAGLSPSARMKFSFGRGHVLEASASAAALRALSHDLTTRSHNASLCNANFLGRATWLDICARQSATLRDLGTSRSTSRSLGLAHQFAGAGGVFEITAKRSQTRHVDYSKMSTDLGITYAAPRLGTLRLDWVQGERIAGKHTQLQGASLSLSRKMFQRPTMVFASYTRDGGASFFGAPREDTAYSFGVSRAIGRKMRVTLSWRRSQSTLENYSGHSIGFDVTFADLRF
ncbi:MAG: hypothetical protein U5N55_09800 [Cypionkella sp.]|nr:hypothetical protein [Cypionkella sp.]